MPLSKYLSLLRLERTLIQLGSPEDTLPALIASTLIYKGFKIGASMIGSPNQIRDLLEFAAKHQVRPLVLVFPMRDANQAVVSTEKGKFRYRYVLVMNECHSP